MKTVEGKIANVNVKEDGKVYVQVERNGSLMGTDASTSQKAIKALPSIKLTNIKYKVIKASQDSLSSLKSTSAYSALIGGPENRIISSNKFGNFIVGPTTFTSHPENIRFGAFRMNGLLTSTMPSTMITPIPTLVFDFPLTDTISNISKISKEFTDFLAQVLA